MRRFIGLDGWPCEFQETQTAKALIEAVKALPGDTIGDDAALGLATTIFRVAESARELEEPRSLPASRGKSEAELRKLGKLATELAEHIQAMRQPAIAALFAEGYNPFNVAASALDLAEGARMAFGYVDQSDNATGRPKKLAARDLTDFLASVYTHRTGAAPTLTTSIGRGHAVSGPWHDFLTAVFSALGIDASAEAQARAYMEKSRQKGGS